MSTTSKSVTELRAMIAEIRERMKDRPEAEQLMAIGVAAETFLVSKKRGAPKRSFEKGERLTRYVGAVADFAETEKGARLTKGSAFDFVAEQYGYSDGSSVRAALKAHAARYPTVDLPFDPPTED